MNTVVIDIRRKTPMLLCPICSAYTAQPDAEGWDRRRVDENEEPLLWPYLDDKEKENANEFWARCPECVRAGARMPLPEKVEPLVDALIRAYQKLYPGTSREKAFYNVWVAFRGFKTRTTGDGANSH